MPVHSIYISGGNGQSIVCVGKSIIDNEHIEVDMAIPDSGRKNHDWRYDAWQNQFSSYRITYPGDAGNDELRGFNCGQRQPYVAASG